MKKKLTYTQAFEELQNLVAQMENAQVSIDDLTQKLKRAGELIEICQSKLSDTEEEVSKLLDKIKA
ncbi:MAG: exodeoxyribonuclease VII small subunit [Bacteroidales bacterium]